MRDEKTVTVGPSDACLLSLRVTRSPNKVKRTNTEDPGSPAGRDFTDSWSGASALYPLGNQQLSR